ncbi:MAG TPA: TetR/AcrR family transcriptional regulator [Solirubrobacteraceae bacterium]|jgi:AcrR family transcriptional regulator
MGTLPPTAQGRATRDRIVEAAARLVADQGASATSVDDVTAAADASKSQIYHYFGDKHGLVEAVIEHQAAMVLGFQARLLASVRSWDELERWRDAMVQTVAQQRGRGGCPVGTLAAALSDTDEDLRGLLSDAFTTWRDAIGGALRSLRDNGLLAEDADLDALTTIVLSAIQGGLLLSKTSRDATPLRVALDGAITHLKSYAPEPPRRRAPSRARG